MSNYYWIGRERLEHWYRVDDCVIPSQCVMVGEVEPMGANGLRKQGQTLGQEQTEEGRLNIYKEL